MGVPDGHNTSPRGGQIVPEAGRTPIDRALTDFTDDARRDQVRRTRQEQADREVVAGLSATFLGTLVELSESRSTAVFVTVAGAHHRGIVAALGPDVVVVVAPGEERRTLLAPAAIDAIREPRIGRSREGYSVRAGPRMGDLLDEVGRDGARVSVTTFGDNRFMGSLLSVGVDQMSLRLDGESDVLTIPLGSIAEAVVGP